MHKTKSFLREHGKELKDFLQAAYKRNYEFADETTIRGVTPFTHAKSPWSYKNLSLGRRSLNGVITVSYRKTPCYRITYQCKATAGIVPEKYFVELLSYMFVDEPAEKKPQYFGGAGYYLYHSSGNMEKFSETYGIVFHKDDKETGRFTIHYEGGLLFEDMVDVTLRRLKSTDGDWERNFLMSLPEQENNFVRPGNIDTLGSRVRFEEFIKQRIASEVKPADMPWESFPETMFWVEANGELAGVALIRRDVKRKAHEYGGNMELLIAPKYRNRGIGRVALWNLGHQMYGHGHGDMLGIVEKTNVAANVIANHCYGLPFDSTDDDCHELGDWKDAQSDLIYYRFPEFLKYC